MPPAQDILCPTCHAAIALPGIRAFATTRCPRCRATWLPRRELAGYQLMEIVGANGLGITFRAVENGTAKQVAVKVLRVPAGAQRHDFAGFTAVSEALALLDHPHCAAVFGSGFEDGLAWQAREWFPAGSLAARGRLTESEMLELAAQASAGLAAANLASLPYCELKPSNFLLTETGAMKVADFAPWIFYERLADDVGTFAGRLFTTPPERLRSGRDDVRTKIYSLGAVLFTALTGAQIFTGETMIEPFFDLLQGPPLRVTGCHESTAHLLERMLAKNPDDRFQNWAELDAAIHAARALIGR